MRNITLFSPSFFVLLLCAGSAVIILVVSWGLFYIRKLLRRIGRLENSQEKLVQAIHHVAEMERENIAQNLHDDLGMQLNVLKLQLTRAANSQRDELLLKELIGESMTLLDDAIHNVRHTANALLPSALHKIGYAGAVAGLCRGLRAGGIKVSFHDACGQLRLSHVAELQAYRVVQELLSNIVKHANASEISISVTLHAGKVITVITHNGAGISDASVQLLSGSGMGLKNIHSRIELINAAISYSTGTTNSEIKIKIPLL